MSALDKTWHGHLEFRADRDTAMRIKDAVNVTIAALTAPTKENASALFNLGAEAVVFAAQAERESA
jgi:hypothetical protein